MERSPTDFGTSDESEKSEGDFWDRLERILKKPEVQQRLLAEAPDDIQSAVISEFSSDMTDTTDTTDTAPTDEADEQAAVTPEKMAEFLGEIEEQVGGQYTVTQLKTFTETNPEMVENLLAEYL